MSEHAAHAEHPHPNYYKVWATLVVLLIISILGPLVGIEWVTLITAFGIAIVKAYLVAKNFMHANVEPRFVVYLLLTMVTLVFLFYAGVSPDVMKHEGSRWAKPQWVAAAAIPDADFPAEPSH